MLHENLIQAGIPSRLLTPEIPATPNTSILSLDLPTDPVERLRKFWKVSIARRFRQRGKAMKTVEVAFSGATSMYGSGMDRYLPDADIYHLHWVAEFVDYRILPRLQQRAPIVWTLHDMNPFTGGCHGSFDCRGYTTDCAVCPQLQIQNHHPQSYARQILNLKRRVYAKLDPTRVKFIAPSRWIQQEANRSVLLKDFETVHIPNAVDPTTFRPTDKMEAKKRLGVPTDKTVLVLCAMNLKEKYKGIPYALEAIKELPHPEKRCVLTMGSGSVSQMLESHGVQAIDLGKMDNNAEMAKVYNAADIMISSSIQDNLPSVVLEAMACELPVVAFAAGGVPDMVQHGETGLLVPMKNVSAFAESILILEKSGELRARMGRHGRTRIKALFTPAQQAASVSNVYQELLSHSLTDETRVKQAIQQSEILG